MKRTILALIVVALGASVAEAQPAIGAVTGTFTHGQAGGITGTGFDTKPAQTPLKADDFQSVTLGAQIVTSAAPGPAWHNNCDVTAPENVIPIATANRLRPNTPFTRNMESRWNGSGGPSKDVSNISLCGQTIGKFTFDVWLYNDTSGASFTCSGGTDCNVKHVRLHQAAASAPNFGFTDTGPLAPSSSTFFAAAGDSRVSGVPNGAGYTNAATMYGAWIHITWLVDPKGGGTNLGSVRMYVNGVLTFSSDAVYLLNTGYNTWPEIYIGNYWRNDSEFTGTILAFWDPVYLDHQWNRVEWASTSNCATAPHREIQPYTAWSNTSITTTWNRESFLPGDTIYVCVWNDSNVPDAEGPFTVGGTSVNTTYRLPRRPVAAAVLPIAFFLARRRRPFQEVR